MNQVVRKILWHLGNIPGFHSSRRIITITSDDWGSIRMPSKETYRRLMAKGIPLENCPYNRFDNLANEEDLSRLFEVLSSVRDLNGNRAIVSANTIVANPDFEKIEKSDFRRYYYEPFTVTLDRYWGHNRVFDLWKQGIAAGIFSPQFHGREHINVNRWMRMLQSGAKEFRLAFKEGVCGLSEAVIQDRRNIMAAFDLDSTDEGQGKLEILKSGHNLFCQIFGFTPRSFIAPTYCWNDEIEKGLKDLSVDLIQSNPFQKMPDLNSGYYRKVFHYNGERNKYGQDYVVRNAYFEPTISRGKLAVDECMERIEIAFRCRKPAVISTHRLNFIGGIEVTNRDNNLVLLRSLLKRLVSRWSNIEFMSVDQLGALMNESIHAASK